MLEGFLTEGPQLFPEDMVTDQPERQIMAEILREKLLLCLDKGDPPRNGGGDHPNSPSGMTRVIEIDATIYCRKEQPQGHHHRQGGSMLKRCPPWPGRIWSGSWGLRCISRPGVKVKENWRDNPSSDPEFPDTARSNYGLYKAGTDGGGAPDRFDAPKAAKGI